MRLGLNLGYSGAGLALNVDLVKRAEAIGFDSVWSAEAYGSDAVTPLAYLAARRQGEDVTWALFLALCVFLISVILGHSDPGSAPSTARPLPRTTRPASATDPTSAPCRHHSASSSRSARPSPRRSWSRSPRARSCSAQHRSSCPPSPRSSCTA